ncbi:putative threonine efflux protein [Hoeflea sp. IMCC20628]|uniref:LysE family translocator n=1 Tax=Hoeflea sp. IMCC20628 TaxID=1620421 RepID=UPI00063AAE43|nr:LysE family translocator [Hoeflea sp. IMCC20628]AKI01748.1 putative threonine efflux protein [Hoeflea sp. IMCC20628]
MPVSPEHFAAFVVASIILLIIPGPTIIMVITQALAHGRKVAFASVLGVGLGDLLATSLSIAGAGALLAASATLFQALKFVGAAYLIWIGYKMWRTPVKIPDMSEADVGTDSGRPSVIFRDSFLITALNPKGILFFVAFVPQFIDPALPYGPQAATYVLVFTMLAIMNAALFAFAASEARQTIRRPRVMKAAMRTGGSLLMMAGVAAALTRRAS